MANWLRKKNAFSNDLITRRQSEQSDGDDKDIRKREDWVHKAKEIRLNRKWLLEADGLRVGGKN